MGLGKVLGVAAALCVGGAAAAAPRVTVGVIDVRGAGADAAARKALQEALSAHREIDVAPDPAEAAVARGEAGACDDVVVKVLGSYDPEGGRALLERGLRVELRCADKGAAAQRAAARLRALGADPGDGHPEIDAASNVARQPLAVTVEPPGARVWIDFRDAGKAPVETLVGAGPRWVSAAAPGHAPRSQVVEVGETKPAAVALALPELTVTAEGIAAQMREAGIGVAVVWNGARAQIWALTDKGTAQAVEEVSPAEPDTVAAAAARVATGAKPPQKDAKPGRSWWVYAIAVGAAGAVLGVVLLAENKTRTQRIEVTWP